GADAGGGRHPVFERFDEIEIKRVEFAAVALLGTIILLPGGEELNGIILLGPIVAAFHSRNENFESLGVTAVLRHGLGERRDFHRVAEDERWLDEGRFDSDFEGFD